MQATTNTTSTTTTPATTAKPAKQATKQAKPAGPATLAQLAALAKPAVTGYPWATGANPAATTALRAGLASAGGLVWATALHGRKPQYLHCGHCNWFFGRPQASAYCQVPGACAQRIAYLLVGAPVITARGGGLAPHVLCTTYQQHATLAGKAKPGQPHAVPPHVTAWLASNGAAYVQANRPAAFGLAAVRLAGYLASTTNPVLVVAPAAKPATKRAPAKPAAKPAAPPAKPAAATGSVATKPATVTPGASVPASQAGNGAAALLAGVGGSK